MRAGESEDQSRGGGLSFGILGLVEDAEGGGSGDVVLGGLVMAW